MTAMQNVIKNADVTNTSLVSHVSSNSFKIIMNIDSFVS